VRVFVVEVGPEYEAADEITVFVRHEDASMYAADTLATLGTQHWWVRITEVDVIEELVAVS
jgi:hypothetical protein